MTCVSAWVKDFYSAVQCSYSAVGHAEKGNGNVNRKVTHHRPSVARCFPGHLSALLCHLQCTEQ